MSTFAENLKARRTDIGMTVEALAERLAVCRRSIELWEQGGRHPSVEYARRTAAILGVTLDWLAGDGQSG